MILLGPLEQQVFDTYRIGENLSSCELTLAQKSLRISLARVLDLHERDFSDYATARPFRTSFTSATSVGPLKLTPRPETTPPASQKKAAGVDGWVSFTSGWDDFDQEYQSIRDQRVNARWVRLLGMVRATIADDSRRAIHHGVWMGVSAEGIDEAPTLRKLIIACVNEKKCDGLKKSDSFLHALTLTSNAAADFATFRKATTDDAKVQALRSLLGEITPFIGYYEPVKQRGVRIYEGKTLMVSLDAGDFTGYETDLTTIINRYWKVGDDALKFEWMTSLRDEPIFKFFFLTSPNGTNQIDYLRRTITLSQGAAESVPAHEIGRALGFRVRTFSVWHPDSCKYEDQSKPDDLLSDGRTGSITADHWTSLKKTYGLATK